MSEHFFNDQDFVLSLYIVFITCTMYICACTTLYSILHSADMFLQLSIFSVFRVIFATI